MESLVETTNKTVLAPDSLAFGELPQKMGFWRTFLGVITLASLKFKKEVIVLLKVSFLCNLSEGLFLPFYALFGELVGGSILDVGIAYAIYSIATGIMIVVFCQRRFYLGNTRIIIIIGFFLAAFAELSYLLVYDKYSLFLVQAISGIIFGLTSPAWDSLFSVGLSELEAGRRWSVWAGGVAIAIGVGSLLGGLVVHLIGFSGLFIIMAAINFLSGLTALGLLAKKAEPVADAI